MVRAVLTLILDISIQSNSDSLLEDKDMKMHKQLLLLFSSINMRNL